MRPSSPASMRRKPPMISCAARCKRLPHGNRPHPSRPTAFTRPISGSSTASAAWALTARAARMARLALLLQPGVRGARKVGEQVASRQLHGWGGHTPLPRVGHGPGDSHRGSGGVQPSSGRVRTAPGAGGGAGSATAAQGESPTGAWDTATQASFLHRACYVPTGRYGGGGAGCHAGGVLSLLSSPVPHARGRPVAPAAPHQACTAAQYGGDP